MQLQLQLFCSYGLAGSQGLGRDAQDPHGHPASAVPSSSSWREPNLAALPSDQGQICFKPHLSPNAPPAYLVLRQAPAPSFKLHQHPCTQRRALQTPAHLHRGFSPRQNQLPRAPGLPANPAVSPLDHPFQRDLDEGLHSSYHPWSKRVLPGKYLPNGVGHMSEMYRGGKTNRASQHMP